MPSNQDFELFFRGLLGLGQGMGQIGDSMQEKKEKEFREKHTKFAEDLQLKQLEQQKETRIMSDVTNLYQISKNPLTGQINKDLFKKLVTSKGYNSKYWKPFFDIAETPPPPPPPPAAPTSSVQPQSQYSIFAPGQNLGNAVYDFNQQHPLLGDILGGAVKYTSPLGLGMSIAPKAVDAVKPIFQVPQQNQTQSTLPPPAKPVLNRQLTQEELIQLLLNGGGQLPSGE